MKFAQIVKYSLLIGLVSVFLMIVDFKFILNQHSLFGYTEFWGTLILFSTVLYFFMKNNFMNNPGLSQFQLFKVCIDANKKMQVRKCYGFHNKSPYKLINE